MTIDELELEFITRVEDEFDNVTCKVISYPVTHGHRVKIIMDQYGDELARVSNADDQLTLYLTITHEVFTHIYNWDRQFERFWLTLYNKYDVNKNAYYKKHRTRRIYDQIL